MKKVICDICGAEHKERLAPEGWATFTIDKANMPGTFFTLVRYDLCPGCCEKMNKRAEELFAQPK